MKGSLILALLSVACVFGCSGGSDDTSPNPANVKTVTAGKKGSDFKVALLTPGDVYDSGWNALAFAGLTEINKVMNATVTNKESTGTDIEEDMREYGRKHYNLVFGHGFEYNDPAMKVGKDFPDTIYVTSSGGGTAKNVGAFRFELEQGFYVAGYTAGMLTRTGIVGSVSVQNYPSIVSTLKAFAAGVKASNPGAKVIDPVYFGKEGDVSGAKQLTEQLIAKGADVIIHQANAAAQGVFDACAAKSVYAMGSNADQNSNASNAVIASAVIVAKPAFLSLAQEVKSGTYTGKIEKFGMDKGAIDFILNPKMADRLPLDKKQKIKTLMDDIKAGKVKVPEDNF